MIFWGGNADTRTLTLDRRWQSIAYHPAFGLTPAQSGSRNKQEEAIADNLAKPQVVLYVLCDGALAWFPSTVLAFMAADSFEYLGTAHVSSSVAWQVSVAERRTSRELQVTVHMSGRMQLLEWADQQRCA